MLRRDIEINKQTASKLASSLDQRDELSQDERMLLAEDVLNNNYWIEYLEDYNNQNISQDELLSEFSSFSKSLSKISNYILYAKDGDKPSKQQYKFYKDEEKFRKQAFANISFDDAIKSEKDGNEVLVIDFFIGIQQFLKSNNIEYKKSMLRLNGCSEYSNYISFFENKKNMVPLAEKYREISKQLKDMANDKIKEKACYNILDPRYAECIIEHRRLVDLSTVFKNKEHSIMVDFNLELKKLREDVLDIYLMTKRPIVFKKITNEYCDEVTDNFFDHFDIIEDFEDLDKLRLIAQVGHSKTMKNHVENILCTNAVYGTNEAMDMLCELISYYVSKIGLRAQDFMIFNYFRNGKSQDWISNKVGLNQSSVSRSITKTLEQILAYHRKNVFDTYNLNFIRDKDFVIDYENTKICKICENRLTFDKFRNDKHGVGGVRAICKKCEQK